LSLDGFHVIETKLDVLLVYLTGLGLVGAMVSLHAFVRTRILAVAKWIFVEMSKGRTAAVYVRPHARFVNVTRVCGVRRMSVELRYTAYPDALATGRQAMVTLVVVFPTARTCARSGLAAPIAPDEAKAAGRPKSPAVNNARRRRRGREVAAASLICTASSATRTSPSIPPLG